MNIVYVVILTFILSIVFGIYLLFLKKSNIKKTIKNTIALFTILLILIFTIIIRFDIPKIELNGEDVTIKLNEEYIDAGATVTSIIDSSLYNLNSYTNLDITKIGEYTYVYSINYFGKQIKKVRHIKVIDDEFPVITLLGEESIILYDNAEYQEPGFTAIDNYDGDLTDKVLIENNILDEVGDYEVKYTVFDSSSNQTIKIRKVERRKSNSGVIYFTFDDGPSSSTTKILDILDKYNIKATFFVLNFNEDYDSVIKRMNDTGHTVALHSYTHDYKYIYTSEDNFFTDLNNVQERVYSVTGVKSMITRFPGGSSNTVSRFNKGIMTRLVKLMNEKGYHYFDWNVDSSDAWSAKNSEDVYNNVISGLRKNRNNVVLMHDFANNNKTIDALESIIIKCKDEGYTFKNITMDTPTVHHGIQN